MKGSMDMLFTEYEKGLVVASMSHGAGMCSTTCQPRRIGDASARHVDGTGRRHVANGIERSGGGMHHGPT